MPWTPSDRLVADGRTLVTFYGDDFTGSTDALLQYHRAGLRSVLLVGRPDPATIVEWARDYDVLGVAGVARSLGPPDMVAEVRPVLEAFRRVEPRAVQYKMCSTADSSPRLGSLGTAIELGRAVFGPDPVPVLAAQPGLGRYTAFGHHFAEEDGQVHRLDRQPTMSRHPATPMTESDLRVHLGAQTPLAIGSLDVTTYALPPEQAIGRYRELLARQPGAVVFDAIESRHLRVAAGLMLDGLPGRTLFALGSGGLSSGLAARLHEGPAVVEGDAGLGPSPVLAVSGSCSAQTARQIRHAQDAGWTGIPIDIGALADEYVAAIGDEVVGALKSTRRGVIVYTALGESSRRGDRRDLVGTIGRLLGGVVTEAVRRTGTRRLLIAGGDTSGRVMGELGVDAIEIERVLGAGVAVCRARANDPRMDGVQFVLKGGQVGNVGLFEEVRLGGAHDPRRTEEG
jgi:uncharacterized protein YgbK (DUF1537 family)